MKLKLPPYVHTFPAPVVLIGCGTVEKPNLITCAWFGTACSEPPMVTVAIRPSRHSYPLVEKTGEFTVNIPKRSQLMEVKYCGTQSGRDGNKFEALGLTAVPCPPLKSAPMMEEAFLTLACEVRHSLDLGTHTLFVGEMVAIYGDEKCIKPSGRPSSLPEEQIVYMDGNYWRMTPLAQRGKE